MVAAHLLLALAIVSVWLPCGPTLRGVRIPLWVLLFCSALSIATLDDIVNAKGLLSIALLVALLIGSEATPPSWGQLKATFQVASIALLFGFAIQLLPGFVGTVVVSPVRLSPDAPPTHLIARFDVATAALFFVALYCRRATSLGELRAIAIPTAMVGFVTTAAVMSVALIAGYISFDPKWPSFALWHLGKTLLVTAVVEEAFFRGFLQDRLARMRFFNSTSFRRAMPVAISAVLFGLVHLPGGWLLAVMATLAGLGYALSYAFTERIEAPIAVHFLVNATHFITFTYPHLAVTH